jgi:squalene-associated FAD-dependent desaturase
MASTVHIIGAGLAGLSAAVRLSATGAEVFVHEAANQAGGRCRSYHDPALGMMIDNGNHLVLSGNHHAMRYLETVGARGALRGPGRAEFDFTDLSTRAHWTVRLSEGRIPWWIFDRAARVPDTRALDYLPLAQLLWANGGKIGDRIACKGLLYERLLDPLLRAALNIAPPAGAAILAAAVLRETVALGGYACHPLTAARGLSDAFVGPALKFIETNRGTVRFGHRLRALTLEGARVAALQFGEDEDEMALSKNDAVILAVPPPVAAVLVPKLQTPDEFCGIVNAHFAFYAPDPRGIIGVVNGLVEWLFIFPDRLSVTISAADHLMELEREVLAQRIWAEVAQILDLSAPLPAWQIVRERRATFAATPRQNALRPRAETAWSNLVLAGDWTATGLPATIEGAIRSGDRAAELVSRMA